MKMSKETKKALKEIDSQIESHCRAYGLKPLPYQNVPETTFEDILEMQVDTPSLETIQNYLQ